MTKLTEKQIKIVSIKPPEKARFDQPSDWVEVVFEIDGFEPFAVQVGRKKISDENLIRVARHYLHMQTKEIAETTAEWRLSEEEWAKLVPPEQAPLNKRPG